MDNYRFTTEIGSCGLEAHSLRALEPGELVVKFNESKDLRLGTDGVSPVYLKA